MKKVWMSARLEWWVFWSAWALWVSWKLEAAGGRWFGRGLDLWAEREGYERPGGGTVVAGPCTDLKTFVEAVIDREKGVEGVAPEAIGEAAQGEAEAGRTGEGDARGKRRLFIRTLSGDVVCLENPHNGDYAIAPSVHLKRVLDRKTKGDA